MTSLGTAYWPEDEALTSYLHRHVTILLQIIFLLLLKIEYLFLWINVGLTVEAPPIRLRLVELIFSKDTGPKLASFKRSDGLLQSHSCYL